MRSSSKRYLQTGGGATLIHVVRDGEEALALDHLQRKKAYNMVRSCATCACSYMHKLVDFDKSKPSSCSVSSTGQAF